MYNYFMIVGTITNVDVKKSATRFDVKVGDEIYNFSFPRFDNDKELLTIDAKIGVRGRLRVIDDKIYTIAERMTILSDLKRIEVEYDGKVNIYS